MLLTLKVNIPAKSTQETFQISSDRLLWDLKLDIISTIRDFDDELNFGLLYNKNKAVFLDESKSFDSLGITNDVSKIEAD
jgi:hypothetical protein